MSALFSCGSTAEYYEVPVNAPGVTLKIPAFTTKNGRTVGLYHAGASSWELCLCEISGEEFTAYTARLEDSEFEKYDENEINGNRFLTYTGTDAHIFAAYYPSFYGTVRISVCPVGYLPPLCAAPYEKKADSILNQIVRRGAEQRAPGMSYVITLEDGTFLIIDGGGADPEDEEALLKYLEDNTPGGGKPVISAWLITHGHGDHMNLANNFIEKYHTKVELKLAGYNFPLADTVQWCFDVNSNPAGYPALVSRFTESIRKYWPDASHFICRAGQRLYLANVQIEFFFTHEDIFPTAMPWINHTSSAFRLTTKNTSVFFPGDCEKMLCKYMAMYYGPALKSDILQVCHHGANGAVTEFYQAIDPDICMWPCSETLFTSDERMTGTKAGYEFNAYLRDDSIKKRVHYHNSEPVILPL